jgi:thioredoxin-like negative regulator of GroEL
MEVFSLIKSDVPKQRFMYSYISLLKLRSKINKHSGFLKITMGMLLSGVAFISWNTWKSNLYKDYDFNTQSITYSLKKMKSNELNLAAEYYAKGYQAKASKIVSQHYRLNPNNIELGLVYAQMLTSEGSFEISKLVLNAIFIRANHQQKQEMAYTLAITFLKEENYSACEYWLKQISKSNFRYNQAQKLIAKIKPFITS